MPRNILIFAVVAAGFAVGGRLGGQVGSIVAGVAAFAIGLLVAERLEHSREARGYWLRHRAAFLEFGLVVAGIAVGSGLLGGFAGFLFGSCSGAWAGSWLGRRWGWSGPALQVQMEARSGYLAVLVSAAQADGVITPAEAGRIAAVGREIFSHLGYGGEQDVAGIVAQLAANPSPVVEAARYLAGLDPELREVLQFEVLKIIYGEGEASPRNRDWLDLCIREAGLGGWTLLKFFDRDFARADDSRLAWLAELGLGEGAGDTEVRAAYLAGAMSYHPDKLAAVPPQIRALAEAKMASINEAYHRLTAAAPTSEGPLNFKDADGVRSFRPQDSRDFHCRCWLCGQLNRVPAHARPETCRCGSCHALVALRFDPAAS